MTNRRRFLQSLSAIAAYPALSAEVPWKLNYMLASSMYGSLPLAEILPRSKRPVRPPLNFGPKSMARSARNWMPWDMTRFAAMLKEHGVGFGGTTRYDLGPFKLSGGNRVVKKLGGSFIVTGGRRLQGEPGTAQGST
jgi:hypothetical protein